MRTPPTHLPPRAPAPRAEECLRVARYYTFTRGVRIWKPTRSSRDGAVRRGVLPEVYTVHVHFSHEDTISAPQLVDELLGRAGHIAEPLHAQFYLTLQLSLAGPILGQLRDHLEEAPCHPCHEVVPC